MTNLVREPRTDKTGKTVNRWVKPTAPDQSSSPAIGAPSVAPAADKKIREDKAFLGKVLDSYPRKSDKRTTAYARFSYQATPKQLEYCVAVLREHDRFREVFTKSVVEGMSPVDISDVAVMYDPELFPDSPDLDCYNHYRSALTGFRLLGVTGGKTQVKDLVEHSEDIQEKARMFVRLDEVLSEEELSGSRNLSRWALMETEHDMDSIVDTIKRHQVSTVREIQGLLGGIVPALLDGAL